MITKWKLRKLEKLGDEFKCPFLLPSFNGKPSEASYDIDEFKETPEYQEFLTHIDSLEIPYEYAKYNDRIFLVLKINDE